jgi:uncharacterized protein (TIGR02453 family)
MITQATFEFLSKLKENNNRDWFQQHKKEYENVRMGYESFVGEMIPGISLLDPSIGQPALKDCLFRIYRDVRFSNDKSPYKTHFGAFIGKGGRKTLGVGYYIHIEPGQSMVAGGVYQPQPDVLKLLRNEIYFNSEEFKGIITDPQFVKTFGALDDFDKMKLPPKDFPSDFPDIDLLKYRSYIIYRMLPDSEVLNPDFRKNILEVFKAMLPFHAFLHRAINNG